MIECYRPEDQDEVLALWNIWAVKDGYKEMNAESFSRIFTASLYFSAEHTFVLRHDGKLQGFACGCTGDDLPLGDVAGYITCVVLAQEVRTDENYADLIACLEESFKHQNKKQSDVLFFNPMMLPWYIPETPKHEHNNAPGVPVDSALHHMLLKFGYTQRAVECAMYLNLADFTIPEEIRLKEEAALAKGYTVELFDPTQHTGLKEMLDGFDNPLWQKGIAQCAQNNTPVVIAALNGRAAGFAGPVIRQENGRGYFTGIGVHPDYEGHGLGSLLFFKLCDAFKSIGTEYMSLYTGKENPALKIYKKAGFIPVREFAIMRKVF